jgi:hypothetical protein
MGHLSHGERQVSGLGEAIKVTGSMSPWRVVRRGKPFHGQFQYSNDLNMMKMV